MNSKEAKITKDTHPDEYPSDMNGELNKAVRFHQSGQLLEAQEIYKKILKTVPNHSDSLHLLGFIAHQTGDNDTAFKLITRAIRTHPKYPFYHNSLGLVLKDQGKFEEAIVCYQKALELKPDMNEAYNNQGVAFQECGKLDEAIACYKRALEINPDTAEAHFNMGNAYYELERLNEAISGYENAIRLRPKYTDAYDNMGKAYQDLGRLEEAISCYEKTLHLEPKNADAHFDLSLVFLLSGKFKEGWKEYEWRFLKSKWERTYSHRFDKPRWDGSIFEGKRLFVHAEQGMGDTIQFVRYLPMVKSLGGKVIVEVAKPLLTLFQDLPGIDELVVWSPIKKSDARFDFYVPLLSIPGLFGTELETIPAEVPYIYADPRKIKHWRSRLKGGGFKMGLVWAGSPTNNDDRNRSCDLENFFPLSQIPGVEVYGLQKGEAAAQVDGLPKGMAVTNLGEEFEDFADTAGVIENLDLVISVDTAAAHLAGAMGKQVWTLLPFAPDWRWLMNRQDTPWYPTMRLFRQPKRGDWGVVFQQVVHELFKLLQNRPIGSLS